MAERVVFSWLEPLSNSVDLEGVLPPGSYTLSAEAWSVAEGLCTGLVSFVCYTPNNDASFELTLSLGGAPQVPGPAQPAAAMLGAALAAIGAAALRPRVGAGLLVARRRQGV